jgi:hypothetical protein
MNENVKLELVKTLRWVLMTAAIGVFAYIGISADLIPPASDQVNVYTGGEPVVTKEGETEYGFQTNVYFDSGGDKLVVASGGEIEVQSGGTLDLQSGATTGFDNALDLDSTLNVDGAVTLNSTLDVDGNITSGTGSISMTDSVDVGVAGTGYDVTFQSGTSGDLFLWDASEEGLYITGTAAQDALDIVDGNVDIADDIDVDGTTNLDVTDIDDTLNVAGAVTFPVNVENLYTPSVASVAITYTAAAGGTGTVLTVGAGEAYVIHDIWVETTTNFDCTGDDCTLVIGDGNDADGFCVIADAEIQAAYAAFTGSAAGWSCITVATRGVYFDEAATNSWVGGMVYDGTDTIDWLLDETSGETYAAGAATIWVLYTRIK